jgi:hypothetical protein
VSVRKKRLSVSVSVFGGRAPLVVTWLIAQTGDPLSPSYYLIVTALSACLRWSRSSAGGPWHAD